MNKKLILVLGIIGVSLSIIEAYYNRKFDFRRIIKLIELLFAVALIWQLRSKISRKVAIIYFVLTVAALVILILGFYNTISFEILSLLIWTWVILVIGISVYGYCKNTGILSLMTKKNNKSD